MNVEIFTDPTAMRRWSRARSAEGRILGCVPTMGALHEGHGDLLRASMEIDDVTILSVFVNPTQFNDAHDFHGYPRTLEADIKMAERLGVSAVFAPEHQNMYGPEHDTVVHPGAVAEPMEGLHRPGHFDGVATVVVKLLNIIQPHRAWFGAKDWQQVAVVRRTVTDLDIPVEIRTVPTRRDTDGLALSSRNARLDPSARSAAPCLWRGLAAAREAHHAGVHTGATLVSLVRDSVSAEPTCEIEYVSLVDPHTLHELDDSGSGAVICAAMWCGGVRLIDNVELTTPE